MSVNLAGTFHCLRAAVAHLRAAGGGSIVTMASVSAALEWVPQIRVNCVSPGFIETPLNGFVVSDPELRGSIDAGTPMGRVGRADEVAGVVAFLLGEDSTYVTGQNIVIDGGSTLNSRQVDTVLKSLLKASQR